MTDIDKLNLRVFRQLIMRCEGTDSKVSEGRSPYSIIFGFTKPDITNFSDHPRRRIRYGSTFSTAAGAYQILERTYDEVSKKLNITGFTPDVQDAICDYLLMQCEALPYILAQDWENAIKKASTVWASLPYSSNISYYNTIGRAYHVNGGTPQPAKSLAFCLGYIEQLQDTISKENPQYSKKKLPMPYLLSLLLFYLSSKNSSKNGFKRF